MATKIPPPVNNATRVAIVRIVTLIALLPDAEIAIRISPRASSAMMVIVTISTLARTIALYHSAAIAPSKAVNNATTAILPMATAARRHALTNTAEMETSTILAEKHATTAILPVAMGAMALAALKAAMNVPEH
jgi:hypothetical protein